MYNIYKYLYILLIYKKIKLILKIYPIKNIEKKSCLIY